MTTDPPYPPKWGYDVTGLSETVQRFVMEHTDFPAAAEAAYALGILTGLALDHPRAMAPLIGPS